MNVIAAADAPRRILVTDDDAAIRRLVTAVLRRAGYQVDTADNGRDALKKISETWYDVIVIDLMMPEMTGFELIAQLKARDILPRFVIVMSAVSPTLIETAAGAGIFAALRKPFEIKMLLDSVAGCIASSSTDLCEVTHA